jgi:hypothetical protein
LSGQWLWGLLMLPWAGDWANINRPKVMRACAITSLSASSHRRSRTITPPPRNAQQGGRRAGTLGNSVLPLTMVMSLWTKSGQLYSATSVSFQCMPLSLRSTRGIWSYLHHCLSTRACESRRATDHAGWKSKLWDSLLLILSPSKFPLSLPKWTTCLQICPGYLRKFSTHSAFAERNARDGLWKNGLHGQNIASSFSYLGSNLLKDLRSLAVKMHPEFPKLIWQRNLFF